MAKITTAWPLLLIDAASGSEQVGPSVPHATVRAEREAGLAMVATLPSLRRMTLGADKAYDAKEFVRELRDHCVTPHVAQKPATAIDRRTSRHLGYALSQWRRKRVEEAFGWRTTVALLRNRGIKA